jgi:hypothetical protein
VFDVGEEVAFAALTTMQPPPTWQWFIGSYESTEAEVRRTFDEPGRVTVRLVAKHPVSGIEDSVSRGITIRTPETPPADDTTGGETKPPEDGGKAPDGGGTPIARRRNEFRLVKAAKDTLARVDARGWRTIELRWSSWQKAVPFQEVDDAVLTVGDQADGCNTGWFLFVPAGSGRLRFKALGYDFKSRRVATSHEGTVPLKGKRVKPGTLGVVTTQSRAAEFECRMEDGTLCRLRIWKIPKTTTGNVMLQGGVEILEWIPPRTSGGGGGKPVPPGALDLAGVGKRFFEDHGWKVPADLHEGPQQPLKDDRGRTYQGALVLVPAESPQGDKGFVTFVKMASASEASAYHSALFRMTEPVRGGRKVKVRHMGAPAYYITNPPSDGRPQSQELCWAYQDVVIVLRLQRKQVKKNLQDWAKQLQAMLGRATRGELPGLEPPEAEGPRIARLTYKSSVWPVRLQDGVLEIQGCGYEGYAWVKDWKHLSSRAKDFVGGASGAGPIVAFTEDGKRWKVVELAYNTGARRNERTFDARVAIYSTGRRGTVIEAGGRRYDLTDGQCKEIDPKTGLYK